MEFNKLVNELQPISDKEVLEAKESILTASNDELEGMVMDSSITINQLIKLVKILNQEKRDLLSQRNILINLRNKQK